MATRPSSAAERGDEIAWYADGDKMVRSEYNPATAYAFDKVFGPATTSKAVYDVAAQPVVKAAMEGINGTVFAYGVTSSGKTHTMHVINDLLDPTGQNLRVREDAQGTYVEGIKEEVVLSPGHALSFIAAGEEHRHVGSNNFNLFSSRSHTIFTLMIESSAHGDEYDGVMYSQLNLIDLAGSESSKTETTGLRRKEGSYINKSLLTLGTVIGKLSDGKACHIPYRDSKLTRLLQSSLSGHGHVSLICTVTPASSNMEETHNTLKFASRAKRVEIYASRNRIIDEKSLIKKYQKEISVLKQELDQLRSGMLPGITHEEILSLKQQLEEGQVKMQSRLEEEEEAKAALMSRIQRLTKLILVSTKNTIPGCLSEPGHQNPEDDKLDLLREGSPKLLETEGSLKDGISPNEENPSLSSLTEAAQGGNANGDKLSMAGITMSDQMDLLVEQVKMLAGEIAFSTSTLKRLVEQSVNDPDGSQVQIQNLEREIQEKRRQMRALEQRIMESGDASVANASLVDMQQTIMKLTTQCSEKGFELELKTADNRILQEQLQQKCTENNELQEKVLLLQEQINSMKTDMQLSSPEQTFSTEIAELRSRSRSQETENKKLTQERLKLIDENRGLLSQNQKLADEASYAKELASAAAVELKNLAEEVTKLSLENARQAQELLVAQEMAYSRSNSVIRKNEGVKLGRRNNEFDDMKIELQVRKQREAALEAALAEKEILEEEYKRKFDEAKKREASLENDLAGMWVLVAKLKKGGSDISEFGADERAANGADFTNDQKENKNDNNNAFAKERQISNGLIKPNGEQLNHSPEFEPLLNRLKAKIQEMKEKELDSVGNGDTDSHVCKVCFESPAAAVLLPCRHFCLCKPCSQACSECPLCRTKITDRIIAFT
ncbi:uncharacterized protein A4U43_C04F33730 [Asparagus officinalis]|uniref:Kinesin-like protein n=1 Tax=Asparagus officinalis TaxID=4686 RepID=A0A5P1FAH7_ASPOF|nr:uncharacterized protein A4U43_C04F33730 [Asparagus officinalis]